MCNNKVSYRSTERNSPNLLDLHLETATVRESLRFSAMLRQPMTVSKQEKYRFVEDVIDMLNMREFADAVVGVPGEGLNVEQRKLLTIGVELAAKPKLLLFLDEPTSGLDSQSSWAICSFLRKLADSGQAVLCTVHQPSAILFQEFDRLLFLAKGGKTVYFGEIGPNSRTLLDYFESHGARKCDDEENPAEYMIEIVSKGTNPDGQEWNEVWKTSDSCKAAEVEINRIQEETKNHSSHEEQNGHLHTEFAMPFVTQLRIVTYRVFQQYWRMPAYIMAKWGLGMAAGLFIGFTFFRADSTAAGMEDVVFSVFMLTTLFGSLVQQVRECLLQNVANLARFNHNSSPNARCTKFANAQAKPILGLPLSWPTSLSKSRTKLSLRLSPMHATTTPSMESKALIAKAWCFFMLSSCSSTPVHLRTCALPHFLMRKLQLVSSLFST
jgi:ABC-type multidrug transport system ATPase subunit